MLVTTQRTRPACEQWLVALAQELHCTVVVVSSALTARGEVFVVPPLPECICECVPLLELANAPTGTTTRRMTKEERREDAKPFQRARYCRRRISSLPPLENAFEAKRTPTTARAAGRFSTGIPKILFFVTKVDRSTADP